MKRFSLAVVISLVAGTTALAATDTCITPAALYHQVSPEVLRAILTVESGMRAQAINRNANGSIDVGIGQINSIHFKSLRGYGIAPENLLDACVGTYVSAWHLKKQMLLYGNTWFAVGAYHSVTPSFNLKYQNLVYKQLQKSGAVGREAQPMLIEQQASSDEEKLPSIGQMQ